MSALLTVVISTRNRAHAIGACFDALAQQTLPNDRFEVLVVDNGSTDRTPEVVAAEAERNRFPMRVIREPRAGLSIARNAGIAAAKGGFIIFLDDDAVADPGWLEAYARQADAGNEIVQGRITPWFERPRPAWLVDDWLPRVGVVEHGPQPCPLPGNLHGGNFGAARHVLERIGTFREDLGAGASGLGEDAEFTRRAREAGYNILYEPAASVAHVIPCGRITRPAFFHRFYLHGRSQALYNDYPESLPRLLGYFVKITCLRFAQALLRRDATSHMVAVCDWAEHLGRVVGIVRRRHAK